MRPAWHWTGSLRTRLALYASLCVAVSIALVCAVIGWRAQQASTAAALALADEAAHRAAATVEVDLQATYRLVRTMGQGLAAAHQLQGRLDRGQLDALLRTGLETSPDWLGFYSVWEPDAIDGQDRAFAGKGAGTDASGRFLSWWNRMGGAVSVQPVEFVNAPGGNDWYDVPCRTRRDTWLDVAPFVINGNTVLATTVATPIVEGDRCLGIVAVDVELGGLQRKLQGITLPMGMQLALLSQRGVYVSHPQAARLGQPAQDLPATALQHVAVGQADRFEDAAGTVHLLLPVRMGAGLPAWSIEVRVPPAQMRAAGRQLVQWAAAVGGLSLLAAVAALLWTVSRSTAPLQRLAGTLEALSAENGQLDKTLPVHGRDELARISAAYNAFVQRLRRAFGAVATASSELDLAAGEIANGNDDLSRRTEQQSAQLHGVSGAVRNLADGIQGNAEAAREAARLSADVQAAAGRSEAAMQAARTSMAALTDTARQVGEITGVIDKLAGQTNILALNAAVESARAGEVGRGFAVVANEVRRLAQQSAEAAHDIHALIEDAVQRIAQSRTQMEAVDRQVQSLSGAVGSVGQRVEAIDQACAQQARDIVAVHDAVAELDGMTQQNAALVEQAAAASAALQQQTERLFTTVRQYIDDTTA
jgi:methyl-accepting chemotaxis protein